MWILWKLLSCPNRITLRDTRLNLKHNEIMLTPTLLLPILCLSDFFVTSVIGQSRVESNGEAFAEDAMDRGYTATGGYGGSMGESTPNRGDRLFSLAVSFVLPSFSLSPLASLSLLVASSLRERAPTSAFPPSFSHAAPVVRTRASREVVG